MKIIADISGNHGGYLEKAEELIREAARCGCDYAKFQYYRPRDMYGSREETELYYRLAVPHDWLEPLFDCANQSNIKLFASVFSVDGIEELLPFNPPFFKFASPLSTWLPQGVYEGMAEATSTAGTLILASTDENSRPKVQGFSPDILLFCPPGHPYTVTDDDLRLFYEDGNYDGFSDHSPGLATPLAFASLGVEFIEKHLKLDDNCIDAYFSATPKIMERLCTILK